MVRRVLPGFGLSLGITLMYLGAIVVFPVSMLVLRAAHISFAQFQIILLSPRTMHAIGLTVWTSFVASSINVLFGFVVAWVNTRYQYPFKRVVDALIDLPFALPTSVAGIALTAGFSPHGWLGKTIETTFGYQVAFRPLGIIVAMTFVGLPFVIRTLEPVLKEIDVEAEEAGASLGASKWQIFSKILFPSLLPATITGFTLAFARVLGEFGSIVFISGNMPMKTEVVSLLILSKLEQYDVVGAAALAAVMMVISFCLLMVINGFQVWYQRRFFEASSS